MINHSLRVTKDRSAIGIMKTAIPSNKSPKNGDDATTIVKSSTTVKPTAVTSTGLITTAAGNLAGTAKKSAKVGNRYYSMTITKSSTTVRPTAGILDAPRRNPQRTDQR